MRFLLGKKLRRILCLSFSLIIMSIWCHHTFRFLFSFYVNIVSSYELFLPFSLISSFFSFCVTMLTRYRAFMGPAPRLLLFLFLLLFHLFMSTCCHHLLPCCALLLSFLLLFPSSLPFLAGILASFCFLITFHSSSVPIWLSFCLFLSWLFYGSFIASCSFPLLAGRGL